MVEKHRRTVLKAASYRLFATLTVFAVSFLYTGSFKSAASIGLTAAAEKNSFILSLGEALEQHLLGFGCRRLKMEPEVGNVLAGIIV